VSAPHNISSKIKFKTVSGSSDLTPMGQSGDVVSQDSVCLQQSAHCVEETTSGHQFSGSETSAAPDLKNVVAQQREIERLNTVVNSLSTKVCFLLSFLGIKEQTSLNNSAAAPDVNKLTTSTSTIPPTSSAHLLSTVINNSNIVTPSFADCSDFPVLGQTPAASQSAMNYVGAARQTTNLRAVQNNFRDAVVAAVYVDRRRSEQRANSFIVTGISESLSHSDT